ncbi:hypothetical protein TNCV_426731 [Trichonephila clavipes]|nr:hypothetical protein TNCV_426731 [Trichonephila clavipes]
MPGWYQTSTLVWFPSLYKENEGCEVAFTESIHSALSNAEFPSHEDHHKPRLPDSIVETNNLHATPQTVNSN